MAIDLRDSVDKWKSHFKSMAEGKIPMENIYMMNQRGRGLGINPRGKAMYKIQPGGQIGGQSTLSPANKGYAMALGRIKNTQKKVKTKRKSHKPRTLKGIKRKTSRGKVRKVKRLRRGKTTRKRKTRKTTKRKPAKRKGRKRTSRHKIKDIFS